jgi:cell wall-associated NlpC family hydrolase
MHPVRSGFLVVCLIATLCPPAHAEPGPSRRDVSKARHAVHERSRALGTASARLATAQSRLDELAAGAERLIEAYNGALVRRRQAGQAYEQARDRLAATEARVAAARVPVAMIAAQSYGGLGAASPMLAMLSDAGGDDGFLHRASVISRLGDERAMVLQQVRDAQQVSAIMRTQAASAYAEQQAAAELAAAAKVAAEAAVARQRRETGELRVERHDLQRQVTAARSRADRLARQRQAALQRARLRSMSRSGPTAAATGSMSGDVAANWALSQLGKPYVWAADGPDTYDCSGLTMRAWEQVGVRIDHWTGTQWTSGPHVPLDQLHRGDLLFFGYVSADPGTIHHVGMYVGDGLMVHAPQTGDVVRVESMWRRDLVGATRPR